MADVDPQIVTDPVALLRTQLDTRRRTTIVPGQSLPPIVVVSEPALRAVLDELELLRGEDARIEKPDPHSDDWIINDLLFRAQRCDCNAAGWDYPGVRGEAESRRYEAKRYRQLVAAARDVWARADAEERRGCECGCQPGQPCGCGLEDCECIGDCPVCDAEGATHVLSAGAG